MQRPQYLLSGEQARLIPVASKMELKNTSVTCAILMAVQEFSEILLGSCGAPTGKRAKIQIWLEPVFKPSKQTSSNTQDRPDALIIVDNGRREWRALVEAKAKNNNLDAEQVERYLDLAKDYEIDSVITISNQFVSTPNQSPCEKINRQKLKKVSLYHWSWSYLETEAKIQLYKSSVSDPEQAYMLEEYVRYLEHESAGVNEFEQMGKSWVDVCKLYFAKSKLSKKSPDSWSVISDWDELFRSTVLRMSRVLETNVTTFMTSKERKNPEERMESLRDGLVEHGILVSKLDVPDAAAAISVEADLGRRAVSVSMTLGAPMDRKRATSSINWLMKQLAKTQDESIMVSVKWPGRIEDTCAEIGKIRNDIESLVTESKGQIPRSFEIRYVSDFGGKFTQSRNFVSAFNDCILHFYNEIGQHVTPWQPSPPRIKKVVTADEITEVTANLEKQNEPL